MCMSYFLCGPGDPSDPSAADVGLDDDTLAASWARAFLVPGAGPCGGAFINVHSKRREYVRVIGADLRKKSRESLTQNSDCSA